MEMTPLRVAAFALAASAGFPAHDVKLRENRAAPRTNPAYDVLVRAPGARRGRCIGAVLLWAVYLH
jgi:hypothetical protein